MTRKNLCMGTERKRGNAMSDERQFTATTQDGIPGHCFCAQVFDPDGNSIAALEPTDEPAIANQQAQWLADACNAHPADGDEMVDETFLTSMGFAYTGQNSMLRTVVVSYAGSGSTAVEVRIEASIGWRRGTEKRWSISFGENAYWPCHVQTRAQLRSLLAALGVV